MLPVLRFLVREMSSFFGLQKYSNVSARSTVFRRRRRHCHHLQLTIDHSTHHVLRVTIMLVDEPFEPQRHQRRQDRNEGTGPTKGLPPSTTTASRSWVGIL